MKRVSTVGRRCPSPPGHPVRGLALLTLLGVLAAGDAAAQNSTLFETVEPSPAGSAGDEDGQLPRTTAQVPSRGGDTVRHRQASIDFDGLDTLRSALETGEPATLTLNLFDDVGFRAVDLRLAPTSSRGYSLAAKLEGVRFGTATIVVNGDVVVGSVRTPLATYTIDSAGGGVCHIREVDPSTLPPLGEPLLPPQSASPLDTSNANRTAPAITADAGADDSVADVLFLYTPAAREAAGGVLPARSLIDMFVAEINGAFIDSGVGQQIFATRVAEVDYVETGNSSLDLRRLRGRSDGYMDIAHTLREKSGADLVHLLVEITDVCGIAYLMFNVSPGFASSGFGLTRRSCGGLVVAHELGHNMGLRHDRHVDPSNSPYRYSHGYVNQAGFEAFAAGTSRWRTIMAYEDQCSEAGFRCRRLPRFSNPDQTHEGDAMGVADDADARRSLNDTRDTVAGFRRAGPDLVAAPIILDRVWQPGDVVVIIGTVTNGGRIESAETTATYYRSSDPVIDDGDTDLGSFAVGALGPKGIADDAKVETAPEAGTYYYGICVEAVEGETDVDNCSAGIGVTVGPTVSVVDARSQEGQPAVFTVSLSEVRDTAVEVHWETVGATAVGEVDYEEVSGTLTIPANQATGTVSVETVADTLAEGDDTFELRLAGTSPAPPSGVVLSLDESQATGVIVDDDGEPSIVDENLRRVLLAALGKPSDGELTVEELASLNRLTARYAGIEALDGLEAATGIRELDLDGNSVEDLAPLGHLGSLRTLRLADNGLVDVSGLEPLVGLESLRLSGNKPDDLSPLSGMSNLRLLEIQSADIADVSPLAGLAELASLNLAWNSVVDLSPLAGLTKLSVLNLNFNEIVDIAPLAGLVRLSILDLWGNGISDISPLQNMTGLYWVDLDDNEISGIGPLARLTGLNALYLNDNEVTDLDPLAGMDQLETLGLNGNGITDIGTLAKLDDLETLLLGNNAIVDISPLSGLLRLRNLHMDHNSLSDLSALAGMTRLRVIEMRYNLIRDVSPLVALTRLVVLDLAGNRIVDVTPLDGLGSLRVLDLSNNAIRDIEPLVSNGGLRNGDDVYVQGNPLSAVSISDHVPALLDRGVDVRHIGLSVASASALEGQSLEFTVYLSSAVTEETTAGWSAPIDGPPVGSATRGADFPADQSGMVTIPAGATTASFSVFTNEDVESEPHETVRVRIYRRRGFPEGVALAKDDALGLIVQPDTPAQDVPIIAPASDIVRQGFVRIINRGGRSVAHVDAVDDEGNRHATSLAIDAGETVHFNSDDLEAGNFGKGLSRGVGPGTGDWRLEVLANDMEVLAYMRTNDGFLTSLHDLVPAGTDGYSVPTFNPAKNVVQVSRLRLFNGGTEGASVTITGVDNAGATLPGEVRLELAAGEARTISAQDLASGTGVDGEIDDGGGKWRLLVNSDVPIGVASLLRSPTGHLTNLSTVPDNAEPGDGETTHGVPLFPAASDPKARQGFARVVNRGAAGTVSIKVRDDTDHDYPPVMLELDENETIQFNSNDLENGNAEKGLSAGVGAGDGDWRLSLTSALDLDVLAYVRRTADGFLTSMHDVVPETDGVYRVPIFNPGSNRNQVSLLRLINKGETTAQVTIQGVDGEGRRSSGGVQLAIPGETARTVSAQDLEAGGDGFSGALGDGAGKWQLEVESDQPIDVMSLLESPTGHLTNLSTAPAPAPR